MSFTAEQEAEFKEAFSLFGKIYFLHFFLKMLILNYFDYFLFKICLDKNANGTITTDELGTVMRSLGSNITEEDLGKLVTDIKSKKNGVIDFKGFIDIMASRKNDVDTQLEIQEALKTFDKEGNGLLLVSEIKHILTNVGEKMSDDEVDELLSFAPIDSNGQIKIADLVKLMFA